MTTNTLTNPFLKKMRFDLSYDTCLLLDEADAVKLLDILQRNPIYDVTGKGGSQESYKASHKGIGMGMVSEERIQKDLIDHARAAIKDLGEPE